MHVDRGTLDQAHDCGVAVTAAAAKTLFELVVPADRLHPSYEKLRSFDGYEPARWMFDDVFQSFYDVDGNFVEQFQTTGFDARCFELYVHAYLSRSGFTVDRTHEYPDFLATKDGATIAIEVTTVGPATSGVLASHGKSIADLSPSELRDYIRDELPIRFGSPLFSKLERRYWDLPHCRDLPIVIFIEAFHEEEALSLTDSALVGYLYGLDHAATWGPSKELVINWREVAEHTVATKTIPSRFFEQPGAEHISAVVFSNSGTVSKFERMGYQSGVGNATIDVSRTGFALSRSPDTMDPSWFSYSLDDPPLVESWGHGLVVLHNPRAIHPISKRLIEGPQTFYQDGRLVTEVTGWHAFSSRTLIVQLGEAKAKLAELPQRAPRLAIAAISQQEFVAHGGVAMSGARPIIDEQAWFVDESEAFLGAISHDKQDDDWAYVIQARDQELRFRAIRWATSLTSSYEARKQLLQEMVALLRQPQRIFPQDAGT